MKVGVNRVHEVRRRAKEGLVFVLLVLVMGACQATSEEMPEVDQKEKTEEAEEEKGPSFDCGEASTKVERTICDYKYLSDLDRELNKSYKQKISIPELRESLRKEQLNWIRNERAKCESSEGMAYDSAGPKMVSCLRSEYLERIRELNNISNDSTSNGEVVTPAGEGHKIHSGAPRKPIKFKIVEGGQYQLCRDYVDMLNQSNYKDPPTCERKVLSGFNKFKEVEWVEITNEEEIRKIKKEQVKMQYLWPSRNSEKERRAWLSVEDRMDKGHYPRLHLANVDMDHDKKSDKVYRFTNVSHDSSGESKCSKRMSYFVKYDDVNKTEGLYERPSLYSTFLYFSGQVRLFYYEGRVRIDYWKGWSSRYHIIVSDIGESQMSQVCGVNIIQ